MCGIVSILGDTTKNESLDNALQCLRHRGPDAEGVWISPSNKCKMGHRRLSIIDLSKAGRQPMSDHTERYHIVLNGEIYNYLELKTELGADYKFHTRTDTEVLLAAYKKWGTSCLEKLIGMFAFAIWDEQMKILFAARDRFGVKQLYYAILPSGNLALSSEIKALHALGLSREPDTVSWAMYFTYGLCDHSERTFWNNVKILPPGHALSWKDNQIHIWKWYDLAELADNESNTSSEQDEMEEYRKLLKESVRLRFRADVPVGINLSGGLDSSILLGLVHAVQGSQSKVDAFTFITGDDRYDELPWVKQMLAQTQHPHHVCLLQPTEIPDLALKVQQFQDEPFGGLPTLAYAKVFERARELGIIVLLDGQGLDEQWAGYDYYSQVFNKRSSPLNQPMESLIQGGRSRPVRPECLTPEFRALAEPMIAPQCFSDNLRNLQYKDTRYSKIPRALRFNDRISMMHSTELREPFLDHRLFELAFLQPVERKIRNGIHKWMLREITHDLLPQSITEVPKRPVQTPQREWLRGVLKEWTEDCIHNALDHYGNIWFDTNAVLNEWKEYIHGNSDNSYYIFQWINMGLWCQIYE